ncbi:hemolysin family protein [Geitlerinema splendidum]|nr:hemolysin family protein [Geitlerinema splendidum]
MTFFGMVLIPVNAFMRSLIAAANPETFTLLTDPAFMGVLALAFLVVIFLNAVFVAGDVAVDSLRPTDLKSFPEDSMAHKRLTSLVNRKDSVVAACVLGAVTMRAWLVLLCLLPAPWLATSLGWITAEAKDSVFFWWTLLAGVIISIPIMGVNIVFSELVAKSLATEKPARVAVRIANVLNVADILFKIPSVLAIKLASLITNRFGAAARFTTDSRAEEEIKGILDSSEESGEIEEIEREMLHSVFEFGDTVAREIMTPRIDVESVPLEANLQTVASLVEATGHSRFPVYAENDDEIVGIVHAKDVLGALARGQKDLALREIMRPAFHVPENKNLHELLGEMRTRKVQLIVVADEFGGTAGIVTIEDIVEELVGEIVDEYDVETPEVTSNGQGHSVSGKLHLDDVNDAIGSEFESEEFDTIGGYVFGLFGRQPKVGEAIVDENHKFTVEDSDGRRILRILVEPKPEEYAEAADPVNA